MSTYAVYTQTGEEDHVAHLISKTIRATHPDMSSSIYVPQKPFYRHLTAEQAAVKGNPLELVYRPLYPGYLFLETDSAQDIYRTMRGWRYETWYHLIGKTGCDFLPMDEEELRWAERLGKPPSTAVIREGKLVIVSGSLMGVEDAVIKVKASRNNVCMDAVFKGEHRQVWVAMNIVEEKEAC